MTQLNPFPDVSPHHARGGRVRAIAAVSAAILLAVATGCANNSRGDSLDGSLADYDQGRYEDANRSATDVMNSSSGQTRDEATYLSGLSAYRLGRLGEAEDRLTVASRSSDPTTAANASATLGLVRLDQNRSAEAADLFQAAAEHLEGDDATCAERYAAAASRMAGDSSWSEIAGSPSNSGEGLFALQVGAFRERTRAEKAATRAGASAGRAGLGSPRVVPRAAERGRTLYVVQFGQFRSRVEASSVRNRLGNLEYIVAPYAGASR